MDYYDILLISRSASAEEIQKAYRTLAKKYHPDVYDGDKDFAEEQMKFINEAYSVLSDPQARKEYDQKLNETENKSNSESSSKEHNADNTYNNVQNAEHEETLQNVIKPFLLIRWPLITAVLFLCSLMRSKYLLWIGIVLTLLRLSANLFNKEYRSKRFTQIFSICIVGFLIYTCCMELYDSDKMTGTVMDDNVTNNTVDDNHSLPQYEDYKKHYDIAQDYIYEGEYDKAIDELNKYNEFFYDYYQLGEELFAEGRYEEAIAAYEQVTGYKNSSDRIAEAKECLKKVHYLEGEALYASQKFDEAAEEFRLAEDYKDAPDRVVEMKKAKCYYQADLYMEQELYNDAIIEFTKAKGYRNAEERILEAENLIRKEFYDQGIVLLSEECFEEAIEQFEKSEHYEDADNQILIAETGILKRYYDEGCKLLSEEHYEDAVTAFIKAENYNDSADKILIAEGKNQTKTLCSCRDIFFSG